MEGQPGYIGSRRLYVRGVDGCVLWESLEEGPVDENGGGPGTGRSVESSRGSSGPCRFRFRYEGRKFSLTGQALVAGYGH